MGLFPYYKVRVIILKFFFIVGEDSGDALAAPLVGALNKLYNDDISCLGIGGPRMKSAGFKELLPMDQISIMGIWEVLPKIPRLLKLKKAIVEEIEKQNPDAVITVDFPDFNFIIAKELKKRGNYKGKIIHYVSPSVWAWRPERAKRVSQFLDGMMCLFPMEVPFYDKHGLMAAHVGHPLVSTNAKSASNTMFRQENNISEDTIILGLFFGSRESEFKNLSSTLKQAAIHTKSVKENISVVVPTLPKLEFNVQSLLEGFKIPVYVSANPVVKWEAFKACDVAIAVSGTAALELAYAGVPHVIAYKVSPITSLILRMMVKVKHVHLANILLDGDIVPEFLQEKCNAEEIAKKVLELLDSPEQMQQQKDAFQGLEVLLSNKEGIDPSLRAAQFIQSVIEK